jgi:hypothetical protein
LTRRHGELVNCLRTLREDLQGTPTTVGAYQPPSPRFLEPPPPGGAIPTPPISAVLTPSRIPDAATAPLSLDRAPVPGAPLAPPDSRGTKPTLPEDLRAPRAELIDTGGPSATAHPLTKRHYDYFAELDDLLARLPVTPGVGKAQPPLDHEGLRSEGTVPLSPSAQRASGS